VITAWIAGTVKLESSIASKIFIPAVLAASWPVNVIHEIPNLAYASLAV
jgi:hypothetical protein